jgi:hypothetical protein
MVRSHTLSLCSPIGEWRRRSPAAVDRSRALDDYGSSDIRISARSHFRALPRRGDFPGSGSRHVGAPLGFGVPGIRIGFSLGAEVDIVGFLVGRYFGLRRYGEIYGYIFAIFTVGSGIGSYLMGLSFDRTHSYAPALIGFAFMLLIASIFISRLGPYRYVSNQFVGPPVRMAEQAVRALRTTC